MLGCVCVRVRALFPARHSWLGCAVWVCAWAQVSAAPRHFWLGCRGVCVVVCALRSYPATPAWGVRCGCACLGSGLGCALPLLARVLGSVCGCVRAPLVPCHSCLGCALWVCVLGLRFRLRPATLGWGVGVCVCLCACFACTPTLLAGVCGVGVCAWARFRLRPVTPGWGVGVCVRLCACSARTPPLLAGGVRSGCLRLGSAFGCAPPLLAGVLGCVCVHVRALFAARHSWLGCAVWVCAWAQVSAAPRHFWLGCRGVCLLVCTLRSYSATPVWGVRCGCACFGSGFGCARPLLAGVLGCVCACVRAPLVPCHSCLGCALWVCVLGLRFRLRHATLGWGVGVCVCLCACFACTPTLLAGVCGVGVCSWPRFRLRPVTPGWGVGVCVRLCACSARTPPLLAGGVRSGCLRLGSAFGCAPPLLAGVLGCVCVHVRALFAARHS